MNERQAEKEGFSFTGIYNRNKEDTKKEIAEEREKRPKARIRLVVSGTGYSAYADDAYFAYASIKDANMIIDGHQNVLKRLKKEYEEKVNEAEERYTTSLQSKEKSEKLLEMKK